MCRHVVYCMIAAMALTTGAAAAEEAGGRITSTELAPIDMSGPPPRQETAPAKPAAPSKPAAVTVDRKTEQRREKPEAKPEPARVEKPSTPSMRGTKRGSGKGVAAFWIMLPEKS
ncbi:MAG: hypothetical protein GY851_13460 [bacterium]|nr:hypothetical protein [bacterium]